MAKFRELQVWQRAMKFTTRVYAVSATFPNHEMFGLTSQLRRATTAMPLNIAEGAGSGSDAEYKRFLRIAQRSAYEVITAIEIGYGLGYMDAATRSELVSGAEEIAAMLGGLIRYLSRPRKKSGAHSPPPDA